MLELIGIDKTFNRGTVNEIKLFENFSLSVKTGEFVSVVGSNGSGKTTLLNLISGSTPVDSGKVILDGVDMTKLPEYKRAKKIGRVFQDPAVGTVPYMTITENLFLAANKGKQSFLCRGQKEKGIFPRNSAYARTRTRGQDGNPCRASLGRTASGTLAYHEYAHACGFASAR